MRNTPAAFLTNASDQPYAANGWVASRFDAPEASADGWARSRLLVVRLSDGHALELTLGDDWSVGESVFPGQQFVYAPATAGALTNAYMHTILRIPYSSMKVRQEAAPEG